MLVDALLSDGCSGVNVPAERWRCLTRGPIPEHETGKQQGRYQEAEICPGSDSARCHCMTSMAVIPVQV